MRVGFICEGKTDFPILKAVVEAVLGVSHEAILVLPKQDRLAHRWDTEGGSGAVKSWCERFGPSLRHWLNGNSFDLLIIHLDADRCGTYKATDTTALCSAIKSWLGDGGRCKGVVIVIPAQASEAWLFAAHLLASGRRVPAQLELEPHPEHLLLREKLVEKGRTGLPHKDRLRYEELAQALLRQQALSLAPSIPELDRFVRKLQACPAG